MRSLIAWWRSDASTSIGLVLVFAGLALYLCPAFPLPLRASAAQAIVAFGALLITPRKD